MENYNEDVLNDHTYADIGQIAVDRHIVDHNYYIAIEDNSSDSELDEVIEENDENDENEEPIDNYEAENLQHNRTYTIIPGVHNNSKIYIDNFNYKYYKKSVVRNKMYLICEKQRTKKAEQYCAATAIVNINDQGNHLDLQPGGHNHGAVEVDMDMPFLRQAVGKRSIAIGAMSLPIRQIYNEEIISHPRGSWGYTFQQAQLRSKRMRNRRRPKIPETIQELVNLLNMQEHNHYSTTLQEPPSTFFQQALILEGVFVGVIFANIQFIHRFSEELQAVKSAGCDGTFKTVASTLKQLRRGSLMTFHVVYKNVSFPMVYALLTSATEETYTAFFQIVRHLLPLNYGNLTIITDFERGLMNAVTTVFPESRLQCCWFHFCQSIVRYCRRKNNLLYDLIKTNVIAANVLRMILALAHLPASRGHADCQQFCIEDGFREIVAYIQQYPDVYNRMQTFLFEYIQNFWLNQVGPAFISVFGSEIRTNNYLESFHSQLLRFFGNHPNIWDFLQKLRILENQFFVEFIQASKNLTIRDQTSRSERATNTHMLKRAIEQLNEHGNIIRCLTQMGHANDGYLRRQIGPIPAD
ncbi:unnamed protein product [Macrosiphum euphorbiae]|uniref:MULE transposase domain-containing protein n=1 Tax=Macrosiphum euphorbiae TaxID=13131 RepID=A0AAV0XP11_9HEMI|nr:unnamed protein product [Macrosiphum euphorbiae]